MAPSRRIWLPARMDESMSAIGAGTFLCDASGEYAAAVGSVPKSGTLLRFEFHLAALANTVDNGIRCSFQDVDLSTGQPDGTPDQSATIASGSQAVGWTNPGNFDNPRTVTAGEYLACVIDNPSFTAGDSFAVGGNTHTTTQGLPYGLRVAGTKEGTVVPLIVLVYSDGTRLMFGPGVLPHNAVTNVGIQDDKDPDEAGLAFKVWEPYWLVGFTAHITASGGASVQWEAKIYDPGSNPLKPTITADSDVASGTSLRYFTYYWDPVLIQPDLRYRLGIKSLSTTSDLNVWYSGFADQDLHDATEYGGSEWFLTTRNNGGAWTDYNNGTNGFRRPHITLCVEPASRLFAPRTRPLRTMRR